MRSAAIILFCTLALCACDNSRADLLSPSSNAPAQAPIPTPGPAPTQPAFSVTVAQILPGVIPWNSELQSWRVRLRYDYTPDPLYPFLIVSTNYTWGPSAGLGTGSLARHNVKCFDFNARQGFVLDEFTDNAWTEPFIHLQIVICAAQVNSGDWFNNFCVGLDSNYWGSVPDWWLHVPVSTRYPFGTRWCSATVAALHPTFTAAKSITVAGWTNVQVAP